jgi:predicted nucleic acid-binding Zn ribbon protein
MEALAEILFSLYQDTPNHNEWVIACLQGAWSGLLGDKISHACRPHRLRHHELSIEVLDPAWMPALSDMKLQLLQRLRVASGGTVRRLSFVFQAKSDPEGSRERRQPAPE